MEAADFARKKIFDLFETWKSKGGTQLSLAKACGINQSQVSLWLRGGFTPRVDSLYLLAKAFSVPIMEFFPPDASDAFLGRLLELRSQLDDVGKDALLIAAEDLLREQRRRAKPPKDGSSSQGAR